MKSNLRAKKLAREKKKEGDGEETSLVTPRGGPPAVEEKK